MLDKMEAVRRALEQAINALSPAQRFGSAFFQDGRAITFAGGALTPATDENKREAFRWLLEDAKVNGPGGPVPALEAALAAGPDVIYLVADADMPDCEDLLASVQTAW